MGGGGSTLVALTLALAPSMAAGAVGSVSSARPGNARLRKAVCLSACCLSPSSIPTVQPGSPGPPNPVYRTMAPLCKFYQQGTCRNGSKCSLSLSLFPALRCSSRISSQCPLPAFYTDCLLVAIPPHCSSPCDCQTTAVSSTQGARPTRVEAPTASGLAR